MLHRPKRSLSQNYLQDRNIARKITSMLPGEGVDRILEIGPGRGILTEFLVEKFGERLFLVEIDRDSVEWLQQRFPELQGRILAEDFLTMMWPVGENEKIAVIGNFPYHITSPIFFRILENHDTVNEVVAMVQKEVADRLVARPGNKTYGLLSVLLQTFFRVNYLFTVPEQVFYPQPKVKSAVIRLVHNERESLPCPPESYIALVKKAFNQRRKTLRNALKEMLPEEMKKDKTLGRRAEQLSPEEFISLCVKVHSS